MLHTNLRLHVECDPKSSRHVLKGMQQAVSVSQQHGCSALPLCWQVISYVDFSSISITDVNPVYSTSSRRSLLMAPEQLVSHP